MSLISKAGEAKVSERIRDVEKRTAGEVVVVIAPASDDHAAVRAAWAGTLTAITATLVYLRAPELSGLWILCSQPILGVLLFFVLGRPTFLRRLVPRSALEAAVAGRAKQIFVERGLTETVDRSGILLFLSEAEHSVHLLADKGIHARVQVDGWNAIVERLLIAIRDGRAEQGLLAAISELGERLAEHFPRRADDRNELSNQVVRLDAPE